MRRIARPALVAVLLLAACPTRDEERGRPVGQQKVPLRQRPPQEEGHDGPRVEPDRPPEVAARYSPPFDLVGVDRAEGLAYFRLSDVGRGASRLEHVVVEVRSGAVRERRTHPLLAAVLQGGPIPPEGKRLSQHRSPGEVLGRQEIQGQLRDYAAVAAVGGAAWRETRLAVSPDGRTLLLNAGDYLYGSFDGGATFTNIGGAELRASYRPVISPDGRRAAYSGCGRPCSSGYFLRIVDLRPGARPRKVAGVPRPAEDISFCPDGRHVFAVRGDPAPDGPQGLGCLMRVEVGRLENVEELACLSYPSYSAGPGFKVSPDRTVGLLVGQTGSGAGRRMPYAWVSLVDPSIRGEGVLAMPAPIFPAVHGPTRRAAWLADDPPGAIVLDLESGRTTRIPGADGHSLVFWDASTLLVGSSFEGTPRVELVPIPQ